MCFLNIYVYFLNEKRILEILYSGLELIVVFKYLYIKIKKHDQIKRELCKKNGITLLEIPCVPDMLHPSLLLSLLDEKCSIPHKSGQFDWNSVYFGSNNQESWEKLKKIVGKVYPGEIWIDKVTDAIHKLYPEEDILVKSKYDITSSLSER